MFKIPGVYVDFKGDLTELKRDFNKVKAMAKEAGTDISNGMKNAVLPNTVTSSFDDLYQNLSKINRKAALTSQDMKKLGLSLNKDLLKNIRLTNKEFMELQRRMLNNKAERQAERAIKSLGRAANLTAMEMFALRVKVGDTKGALRGLKVSMMSGVRAFKGFAMGAVGAGVALSGIVYGIKRASESIWDTGRATKVAINAYKEIAGSVSAANKEFAFLRETSDQLGLNFYTLRSGYIGFLAAAKDSKIPMEEVRKIFKSVSNAGAVLGLSNERMKLTFLALEQMMSKGKVSMEELRRQMGDNLYGAFQKAAKAMGWTVEKLDKMVSAGKLMTADFLPKFRRQLEKDFTGTIDSSVKATNKFIEAWEDLKNEMADSGFMESAAGAIKDITDVFKDKEFQEGMRSFARGMGSILSNSAKLAVFMTEMSPAKLDERAVELNKMGLLGVTSLDGYGKLSEKERRAIVRKAEHTAFAEDTWTLPEFRKPAGKKSDPIKDLIELQKANREKYAMTIGMANKVPLDPWAGPNLKAEGAKRAAEAIKTTFPILREEIELNYQIGQAIIKGNKAKEDSWILYDKGAKRAAEAMGDIKNVGEETADAWKNAFDGWAAGFSSTLNDMLWKSDVTFKDISRSFAKMLTQMAIQAKVIDPIKKLFTGGGFDVKSLFSGFFGGGTTPVINPSGSVFHMANGGIINEHVVGMGLSSGKQYEFGESGAEAVVPRKDWGGGGQSGNTNIFINAVDAKSFDDMVRRNPGAIISVVGDNISDNGALRHTIGATI